jgi:hypothetical protein
MKIVDLIDIIETKKPLTCSMVAEIFATSPYAHTATTHGANNEFKYAIPHAQMHTRDGFYMPTPPPMPPPTSSEQARIQAQATLDRYNIWTQWDSQLFSNPTGVTLYNGRLPNDQWALGKTGVFMDEQMTDKSGMYNRRTGTPYQAAVTNTTYQIKAKGTATQKGLRFVAFTPADPSDPGAPGPIESDNSLTGELPNLLKNKVTGKYEVVVNIQKILPETQQSNPHSMFEDAESAIMTLTAVLMSAAGLKLLKSIKDKPRDVSLVAKSKTAILALNAAVQTNQATNTNSTHSKRNDAVKMVDRVNQFNAQRQLTGAFQLTPAEIKYTSTIVSEYPAGELMIVTHYPVSTDYPDASDEVESAVGVFENVAIDNPLPELTW